MYTVEAFNIHHLTANYRPSVNLLGYNIFWTWHACTDYATSITKST